MTVLPKLAKVDWVLSQLSGTLTNFLSTSISDSTAAGRAMLTAADAAAQRALIDLTQYIANAQILPVANTTARAALLVTLANRTPAIVPSGASPVIVYRADAACIEYTVNGTTWSQLVPESDSGWVTCTRGANWAAVTGHPLQVRKRNGVVYSRGAVVWNSGASDSTMMTVPAGYRPSNDFWYPAIVDTNTDNAVVQPMMDIVTGDVFIPPDKGRGTLATGSEITLVSSWLLG